MATSRKRRFTGLAVDAVLDLQLLFDAGRWVATKAAVVTIGRQCDQLNFARPLLNLFCYILPS